MNICIIGGAILAAIFFIVWAMRSRRKNVRQFNARHSSIYTIGQLTQQSFDKAVRIVSDIVKADGADIEVMYNGKIIFNGYIDICEDGKRRPHFWYNKNLLDEYGIKY